MKRSQYTRILVEGERSLLERLAFEVERSAEIRTVRSPETGLVMHKARDAVSGQPFYVGELLVTACTVQIGAATGYGMCLGEDLDKAYRLAVVDAAFHAGHPATAKWVPLLLEEERSIRGRHAKEMEQVRRTRVQFENAEEYTEKGR